MDYTFLTDKFYSSGFETLEIFNSLLSNRFIIDQDMYGDGTYLTAELKDDPEAIKLLSSLISDLDTYKALNVKRGYAPLSLNALHEIHLEAFGREWEIMWDQEADQFDLRCTLENDEEEDY